MTTMSTPSPQLSREEELALWREKRKSKEEKSALSKTPKIPSRNSSSDGPRYSAATISYRRGSSFRRRSSTASSQQESPFLATPRQSSNVSCRKPPRRRRDMSTASSRLKQKTNLPTAARMAQSTTTVTRTPQDLPTFSRRPRRSLSADMHLMNRPSLLLSTTSDKENTTSRVNQIRSRAAKRREQHPYGEDDSSKLESSKATTYRTPLTYGEEHVSTATSMPSRSKFLENDENEECSKPSGILDISICLPFEDVMSPLSTTSVAASPASTISSNIMESQAAAQRGTATVSKDKAQNNSPPTPVAADTRTGDESVVAIGQDETNSKVMSSSPESTASTQSGELNKDDSEVLVSQDDDLDTQQPECTIAATVPSLDFQGIEDDDDSSHDEPPMDVRKCRRRRDSTYMRLPTPEPEKKASISPCSTKSAFVPVKKPQLGQSVESEDPLDDQGSPGSYAEPMEDCDEAEAALSLSHNVTRLNDRAILEAIPETQSSQTKHATLNAQEGDSSQLQLENHALCQQVEALRIANCNLEKKLHVFRHSYEQRVTPFRDTFEAVSSLPHVYH